MSNYTIEIDKAGLLIMAQAYYLAYREGCPSAPGWDALPAGSRLGWLSVAEQGNKQASDAVAGVIADWGSRG